MTSFGLMVHGAKRTLKAQEECHGGMHMACLSLQSRTHGSELIQNVWGISISLKRVKK